MLDAAQKVIEKYEELESELASPDVIADQAKYTKLQKQYKGLEKSCLKAKEFVQLSSDLQEWKQVLAGNDPELSDAAKEEIPPIEKRIEELENELQILMVPKEPWDFRNATLEIRAGTGGDESALFAGDLFRMYRGYCDRMGWKMTVQDASEGTVGGYKEIRVFIEGDGAKAYLSELTEKILPEIQRRIPAPSFSILAGYSLCGLFAVYAAFTSNAFKRIVCGSGSLWYPGFLEFCKAYEPSEKIDRISFSLGDKEALSQNPVYATVKTNTLEIQSIFQESGVTATFTEFPGNHFFEADKRLAKGITSVL